MLQSRATTKFISLLSLAGLSVAAACAPSDGDASDVGDAQNAASAGSVVALPGRIEAENYNTGGENVGYRDTTPGNNGKAYRADDVDIEATSDAGGGYDIGWTAAGEWLAFTVNVATAGPYDVTARVSSAIAGTRSLHLELDGKALGPALSFAGGAGWASWQDVTAGGVSLPAGQHALKIVFDTDKIDLNYIDLKSSFKPIVFGMYNNTAIAPGAEQSTPATYRAIANKYFVGSKMKVDRVFNSSLPSSYASSAGAQDPANGNVSFLSVKPPGNDIAGITSGKYDATIKSLCGSIPAGSYHTIYHEPENDMSGPTFVAMFRHYYAVCKAANPAINVGYVAMAYQWRAGSSSTATPDDWWVGSDATDFLGVDAYAEKWSGAHSLDTAPDFQRWYGWALPKGKPVILPEYGVEDESTGGFDDATRASIITGTMNYLATQPKIRLVSYWNGTSATPGGVNHYLNPTTSHPSDTFSQARAAWNAGVQKLGSSGTGL